MDDDDGALEGQSSVDVDVLFCSAEPSSSSSFCFNLSSSSYSGCSDVSNTTDGLVVG